MEKLFEIIHEDADLLVINKQAGLACHPTKGDVYSSLISRVRLHLDRVTDIHMVNRLDRETSGVVVVAKHHEAALRLRRLWEDREVFKLYKAIVHGWVGDEHGVISAPLGKDEKSILAIKDCVRPDGAGAETEYWVEKRFVRSDMQFSLLRVAPRTGRKHQIRIHLAHIGHSIVGEKIYGGDEDLYLGFVQRRLTAEQRSRLILFCQALHAQEILLNWQNVNLRFEAEPETWFEAFHSGGAVSTTWPDSESETSGVTSLSR